MVPWKINWTVCWKRVSYVSWLLVTYFLIPQGGLGALCIPALMLGCALGVTGPSGTLILPSFALAAADEVVQSGSVSSTLRFLLTIRLIFCHAMILLIVHSCWISPSRLYSVLYYAVVESVAMSACPHWHSRAVLTCTHDSNRFNDLILGLWR